MAPLCLFYFMLVGAWLGAAGILVERALPSAAPRRWIWCVTILGSIALPMALSTSHSSHVIDLWGHELLRVPAAPAAGDASASALRGWLDCGGSLGAAIGRVWFLAAAFALAWGAASAWRLHRLVRSQRRRASSFGIVDGVKVTLTETLGPATTGVWRPRVLLPRWVLALPAERRRYVVRHEEEHRRARDATLLTVASVLVALMPWNVPLWWHLQRLRLAVEMDCDRRVVAALGDAVGYGALLLDVATALSRGPRPQPALLGGSGMLERRLTALVAAGRRGVVSRFVAPVAALVLVAVVLSIPHPEMAREAAPATGTTGGASIVIPSERSESRDLHLHAGTR